MIAKRAHSAIVKRAHRAIAKRAHRAITARPIRRRLPAHPATGARTAR